MDSGPSTRQGWVQTLCRNDIIPFPLCSVFQLYFILHRLCWRPKLARSIMSFRWRGLTLRCLMPSWLILRNVQTCQVLMLDYHHNLCVLPITTPFSVEGHLISDGKLINVPNFTWWFTAHWIIVCVPVISDLSSSPPGPYQQDPYITKTSDKLKNPPILPPHLLQVLLNKDTGVSVSDGSEDWEHLHWESWLWKYVFIFSDWCQFLSANCLFSISWTVWPSPSSRAQPCDAQPPLCPLHQGQSLLLSTHLFPH